MSGERAAGAHRTAGAERGRSSHKISIIIPAWHDAENLAILLPKLAQLESVAELIVVDASGDLESQALAAESGARFVTCASPSRGAQMNLGARAASGEIFVFQHADSDFDEGNLRALDEALRDPQIIGGAFYRKFDDRHPRLMWLEPVARFLTRNGGTLFGDQSVFVRREVFLRLRGFAEIPLMEDMEFSRRLRAAGKVAVLDPPVQTSARRHLRDGAWKTSLQNGLFIFLYKLGVSPERLHRWYYARKRSSRPGASSTPAAAR